MSGTDRRVDRTRSALIGAFIALFFERGYARVTIRSVIDRANVGRSTFYEHFSNKEELLEATLSLPFLPIALCATGQSSPDDVRRSLEHMWPNRAQSRAMLREPVRSLLARYLRNHIGGGCSPLAAAAIAETQIGLLTGWLLEETPATIPEMTNALVTASKAIANAFAR